MNKCLLILTLLCFSSTVLFAQQEKLQPFELNGTINADTGTLKLLTIADSSFYPKIDGNITSVIKNGRFKFSGRVPYPVAFNIAGNNGLYLSSTIYIEPGTQTIKCNIDSNRETPAMDNKTMADYNTYHAIYKSLILEGSAIRSKSIGLKTVYKNKIPDSARLAVDQAYKAYYKKSDSSYLSYIKEYPNSYLGLWHLINLMAFGYENIFDAMYANLSDSIRSTYSAKVLFNKIQRSSVLALGKPFPNILVTNNNNQPLDKAFYLKNKYTLVDFWYSHCVQCIAQFPDLIRVYDNNRQKGFEVIGISTDQLKYRANWQKVIKAHDLPWQQFWDINGTNASRISINAFPTNFLLDNSGNIIAKDLSPTELAAFLKEKL